MHVGHAGGCAGSVLFLMLDIYVKVSRNISLCHCHIFVFLTSVIAVIVIVMNDLFGFVIDIMALAPGISITTAVVSL